ncbi:MAG TPA: hypothetical protein VJL31_18745 [Gemmatimonadales bacterium]|nr:hypothetical protein [Gemmatimonadales bacterium]
MIGTRIFALLERIARDLAVALIIGVGIGLTLTYVGVGEALGLVPSSPEQDWQAYLGAAERLRAGAPLYPQVADPGAASVYRYAPWFAAAWVPLTFLPRDAVSVGWVLAMFAASGVALWPLITSRRWGLVLLGGLLAPFLAGASIHGNVQPLIVLALVRTVDGRAGPVAVGVSASLKGFPLLYAAHYAALGEWRRCLVAVAVALVLTAPMLLFDLSHYPLSPGPLAGLWLISPIAWAAGALVGLAVLVRFARGPAGWFSASLAVVMAMPRLLYYDMTFLLVTGRELLEGQPPSAPTGDHRGRMKPNQPRVSMKPRAIQWPAQKFLGRRIAPGRRRPMDPVERTTDAIGSFPMLPL